MMVAKGEPYDRAARRLADNRAGTVADPVEYLGADDPIARATYADPKARHFALVDGDNEILAGKRAPAGGATTGADDAEPAKARRRKPKQADR